jgi:multidrug efflux pump subunit AcrB
LQLRGGVKTSEILSKIQADFAKNPLAGVEIAIERENNGPPTGKPISIEIAGDDFAVLQDLEKKVRAAIVKEGIQGIQELKSDLVTNKPEIIIGTSGDGCPYRFIRF